MEGEEICLCCHNEAHAFLKEAYLDFLEGKSAKKKFGRNVRFRFCS